MRVTLLQPSPRGTAGSAWRPARPPPAGGLELLSFLNLHPVAPPSPLPSPLSVGSPLPTSRCQLPGACEQVAPRSCDHCGRLRWGARGSLLGEHSRAGGHGRSVTRGPEGAGCQHCVHGIREPGRLRDPGGEGSARAGGRGPGRDLPDVGQDLLEGGGSRVGFGARRLAEAGSGLPWRDALFSSEEAVCSESHFGGRAWSLVP